MIPIDETASSDSHFCFQIGCGGVRSAGSFRSLLNSFRISVITPSITSQDFSQPGENFLKILAFSHLAASPDVWRSHRRLQRQHYSVRSGEGQRRAVWLVGEVFLLLADRERARSEAPRLKLELSPKWHRDERLESAS